MKIKMQNEVFEFTNQINLIEELFGLINKKLEDNHLQMSHMLIDEVPVYHEYYDYFAKHIEEIEVVEVICNHLTGLVNETIVSSYEYLLNAGKETQGLTAAFYQGPKRENWNSLADLFEGIQWIIDAQNRIDQIKDLEAILPNYSTWNEYVQSIKQVTPVLLDLEDAMINRDHVLIGDLLLYEMLPIFNDCVKKLLFLIPGEEDDYVS